MKGVVYSVEIAQLIKKMMAVFLLLLSLVFTILVIIIIWALIESTMGNNTMESEDILLSSLFIILSSIFAFIYWFFCIKLFKRQQFSNYLFVGLKSILFIFGITILVFSWFSTISYAAPNLVLNLTTFLLLAIGFVHIILFGLLFVPKIKNGLIQK